MQLILFGHYNIFVNLLRVCKDVRSTVLKEHDSSNRYATFNNKRHPA